VCGEIEEKLGQEEEVEDNLQPVKELGSAATVFWQELKGNTVEQKVARDQDGHYHLRIMAFIHHAQSVLRALPACIVQLALTGAVVGQNGGTNLADPHIPLFCRAAAEFVHAPVAEAAVDRVQLE